MSDYQDFCESFGGCASDPDFMDSWFNEYLSKDDSLNITTEEDSLPVGKVVHIIKLRASCPARPEGIIWNKKLKKALNCAGANYLSEAEFDDPASWFVRKGFTVRSSKINGYWYQVVFKEQNNMTLLSLSERKDYESICSNLNPNWVKSYS